jgi:hypothetical protein
MKATHYISIAVWVLLVHTTGIAQTLQTDTLAKQAVSPDTTVVAKSPAYDTGRVNPFCPTCTLPQEEVNNNHVTPYYRENKPYADVHRTANMKPGILSTDGSTPSIKGARPSGTAYYYNGVRLLDSSPIRLPGSQF